MTPSTLPPKLYRPLAEVKSFVEKMPDGVTLTKLSNKVGAFGSLNKKEKDSLIEFLEQRESVLVIQAKPLNSKNVMTFLRHKKYGYPAAIPGYVYPLKHPQAQKAVATAEPPKQQEKPMETLSMPASPEALRKQAEQLLRAAEAAEKKRNENDLFNKKLQPVKLEICQAAGKMQRKLDEFIDCMDEMNKAIQKLKEISAQ